MLINIRCEILIQRACELANTSKEILLTTRKIPFIYYRYSIIYILHNEGYSSNQIGKALHKNHVTILHAISEMEYLKKQFKAVKFIYDSLSQIQLDIEIKEWCKRPQSSDIRNTAIYFYNLGRC